MKNLVKYFTLISGFISLAAISQNKNIAFDHGSFKELKEKALKENKLIFIDAYTTWCGPCKWMAKTVFTNDTVADYFNANFVNAKIDMEKGEGIELAKQYEVMCYPNLLFIDGNGNLQHRLGGAISASEFIALAKTAQDKEKNFAYHKKNYEANKTNSSFIAKYIEAQQWTCLDSKEAVANYFALQKEDELASDMNWEMLQKYTEDIDSREFVYLLANKQKFDVFNEKGNVDRKIADVNENALLNIIRKNPFDKAKYDQLKNKILMANFPGAKKVIFESDLKLAKKTKDWNTFSKLAIENVDTYYSGDPDLLNSMAWTFYESVTDKQALTKAAEWAKKASDMQTNYANLDTYASVLYKSGNKKLALETANKAIEAAKKEGYAADDYKSTTDLIRDINALK